MTSSRSTSRPSRRQARARADVPGLPTRRAALRLLDAVLRRGEALETALHAAAQGLAVSDRSLAHAIAAETLRWMVDLDRLIDEATPQRLPDDAKARMVLRMALAQLLRLETPAHAVIATALPLVEGGPRRLVHGVIGTVSRAEQQLPPVPTLPEEAAERWRAQWGEDIVAAAARALGRRAPIDLTLADASQTEGIAQQLGAETLMPGHLRMDHDTDVTALPGFDAGGWWVQDLAASLAARLAGKGEGRSAIDLCAAPGGKTMQLAAQGWAVTAIDRSAKRLERLSQNMKRNGLAAEAIAADALTWEPQAAADLVLLDAPCSATGIFRRHPDVLHRAGTRQIAEMAEQQAALLSHAATMVKPGGRLIYATCSLERAEGEERCAAFLAARPDFAIQPPRPEELPPGIVASGEGWLRILPGMMEEQGGLDGFFIARLRRMD